MQVEDAPDGDGFLRNNESSIFSVDTLERNASKGHGLVTSVAAGNNVLLVGTNKGWIVRHDFLGENDTLGWFSFLSVSNGCVHGIHVVWRLNDQLSTRSLFGQNESMFVCNLELRSGSVRHELFVGRFCRIGPQR